MRRGTRRVLPSLLGIFVVAIGSSLGAPPPAVAAGSALLSTIGVAYEESFDTLAISGTANTGLPTGWDLAESGSSSRNNAAYAASTGSDTAGDVYSFGAASVAERAYGTLFSGTLTPTIGASFTNDTGSAIGALQISYVVEMWRAGATNRGVADRLDFQISTNASSLTTGIWTDVNSLDALSPNLAATAGALVGNDAANRASVSSTITGLSIADDATFWIRWNDSDIAPGADDGLGVDTFSLTPLEDDAAPSVSTTSPVNGATGVSVGANLTVEFSEAVNVSGSWFTIECATTGSHSATVSGGPTTFTLDPDSDFADLDDCAVTIVAAQVGDQDGNDPPDNMNANYSFSFFVGDICQAPFTPIYDIQGTGNSVTISGSVSTEGVVVGDFEGGTSVGLQGFFIQDVTGDGDNATSDGLFIFTNDADNGLDVGDYVRVTGSTSEFNQQSQITATAAGSIVDCGTAALPGVTDINLPQATSTELERYEGMRVRFPQTLVISEYFEFEQFGEIVLGLPAAGEDRLFTPTHLEEPGSPAYATRLSLNQRSQVRLNDGLANSNPTSVRHPNGAPFSLSNRFRGGDHVANAVGILGERTVAANPFPRYRIEPTGPADYTAVNTRDPGPDPVGGTIQVAAMNTLNYFLTPDYPTGDPLDNKCGPLQNVECRGHDFDQPTELSRQRTKLIAALSRLGAEVIGLNELENTPGVDPVGDIVAGLNAVDGAGTWSYVNTGVIGGDAIRVGLVYKPGVVTPLGTYQILDSSDDPRFIDNLNRPVLAQTFAVNSTGAVFTIAVNHLKSKNAAPACAPDSGDGQGSCSEVREAAAQALVDWLASDPTGSADPDFLIVGDLNSYAKEDPIDAVRAGSDDVLGTGDDFTNLIARYMGDHAYSFVFDAMVGYLDHALATSSLEAQVTGATEWHINSDEPDILDYDTSFKPATVDAIYEPNAYRSSDHDPVIVGLNLTPSVGKVTGTGTWADGAFDIVLEHVLGVPSGITTLTVPDGTLSATSFDWLTVAGNRATFQGRGTFNGDGGFGFVVLVDDGGSPGTRDRIRVRIWRPDGTTVHDSQPGAPLTATPTTAPTSGNLVVHKLK